MSMRKEGFLLAAAVLLSIACLAQAQMSPFEGLENSIGVTAGITYLSSYIWRGFDMYPDNHSSVQPFASFEFLRTPWTFDVSWRRAVAGDYENYEEFDFTIAYAGDSLWPETSYTTDWQVGYTYYSHPDNPVRFVRGGTKFDLDYEDIFLSFSMPNICTANVVPSYTIIYLWPSEGGKKSDNGTAWSLYRNADGFLHVFGLDYDWTITGLLPDTPEQIIHCSAALVYNQGMGRSPLPRKSHPDEDWSHVLLGATTDFDLGNGFWITPGAWFQKSMDDSVNTSDEYYVSLTGQYRTR